MVIVNKSPLSKIHLLVSFPDLPKKTALKMIKDEFFLFLLRNVSFVYINLNVGKTLHQQNVDNKFQKNSVLFVWHAKVSLGNTA